MGCNSRVGTLAVTSGPCVRSFVDVFWNQKEAEAGGRGGLGRGRDSFMHQWTGCSTEYLFQGFRCTRTNPPSPAAHLLPLNPLLHLRPERLWFGLSPLSLIVRSQRDRGLDPFHLPSLIKVVLRLSCPPKST